MMLTNDDARMLLTISTFIMTMIQDGDNNDDYARMVMTMMMMTMIIVIMLG